MDLSIEKVDLAMKVQTNLQKKILEHQAENIMKLVKSVTDGDDKGDKGVNKSLQGRKTGHSCLKSDILERGDRYDPGSFVNSE